MQGNYIVMADETRARRHETVLEIARGEWLQARSDGCGAKTTTARSIGEQAPMTEAYTRSAKRVL